MISQRLGLGSYVINNHLHYTHRKENIGILHNIMLDEILIGKLLYVHHIAKKLQ